MDAGDDVEIFEVNLLGNKISPPRKFRGLNQENSITTVGFLQKINDIEDDSIREFLQNLECKSKLLSVELDFMANYFSQAWGLSVAGSQTPKETLHVVMEQKKKSEREDNLKDIIKKRKRDDENSLSENIIPNPLVYFNVEGEIVPVLRSTIMRVIPQSQLVSGRWQDQPSDVDEDGNLIVRYTKDAFKHILASLQVHNPTLKQDFPLEIFVNEYSKHTIEETLDFLQITPHFILFLDCEF
jgi:hypothetical protein